MKTLAIMIRSHGLIPVNFDHGLSINQILDPYTIPYNFYNIQLMTTVSLAKLGGVCYGNGDVDAYSKTLKKMSTMLYERENVRNTDDLVNYIFGKKPKLEEIENLNKIMFSISYPPEIRQLSGHTIQKIYQNEPSAKGLGVFYLASDDFNDITIQNIKTELSKLTEHLTSTPNSFIYKTDILNALKPFDIFKLIFIDLSCYGYVNLHPRATVLTDPDVEWLNHAMTTANVKGGYLKKRNNKKKRCIHKRCTNKKCRSKKRNKNVSKKYK